MIPGHFIARNETCKILLHFPKDSESNFKFETKIFNIFNFGREKSAFLIIFSTKNSKRWKFLSKSWNFILNLSECGEGCYDFHFLQYNDQESWSRTQILINIRKCFFLYPNICVFSLIHILWNQNLEAESIDCQISLTIVKASKNLLVAQNDCIM